MPVIGTLPCWKPSSPSWMTSSPTAVVMSVTLIESEPPRWYLIWKPPLVSLETRSTISPNTFAGARVAAGT